MKEAGYGPDHPLHFLITTTNEKPMFAGVATIYQKQMAKIGVKADIEVVEKVQMIKKMMRGKEEWDLILEDWVALLTVDHQSFVMETTSPQNWPNITDKKVDEMFGAYRLEMDPEKREKIGNDLQRYVAENMYWGTICGSPMVVAIQKYVHGFKYRDHFKVLWEDVWKDE